MTRVTKCFPPRGNLVSESIADQHFEADNDSVFQVEQNVFKTMWLTSSAGDVTIPIPLRGSLILEYADGER